MGTGKGGSYDRLDAARMRVGRETCRVEEGWELVGYLLTQPLVAARKRVSLRVGMALRE